MSTSIYPQPQRVFHYFSQLSAVPRGSGNMKAIADYCEQFAARHALDVTRDEANNIIIRKNATAGYETSAPLILQGHLDMVCQKSEGVEIDFENDPIPMYIDIENDVVSANGTTLGADNGIAVAMILSILESEDVSHPALEVVFTTDEETGMIGAGKLDVSQLKGKRMINLDAEEDDTLTVSCAGGSDFVMTMPICRQTRNGHLVTVTLRGLKGGHSGVEIHAGRVNADILGGRFLWHMIAADPSVTLADIGGGDKANAIPNLCSMTLCVEDATQFCAVADAYLKEIACEISDREPTFAYDIVVGANGEHEAFDNNTTLRVAQLLSSVPNGVMEMSVQIKGLVETSLNLGIMRVQANGDEEELLLHFALRSNKRTPLKGLEERLSAIADAFSLKATTFGHYPPWEFKSDSALQEIYKQCYTALNGVEPKVEAIHAGLECAVFAGAIEGLDCIAMGPSMCDVHTVNERLSICSTERTYRLLLDILEKCR